MSKNFWTSVLMSFVCAATVHARPTDAECERSAIELVTNFLARVEKPEPLSYREECAFFGELSLTGAFLYWQYGYIHESGRWKRLFRPKKSLLGNVIQAHRDVFSTKPFGRQEVFYTKDIYPLGRVTVVLDEHPTRFTHGWLPATTNRISKTIRFQVSMGVNGSVIQLCDSSVDGVSVLYLLGFRERKVTHVCCGEPTEMNALHYAEKSPDI